MNFRLATLQDLSYLKEMYQEIAAFMIQNNLHIWDEVYPCDFIEEDINNNQFYVLVDQQDIVAGFSLNQDNPGAKHVKWLNQEAKALYLDRFGVNIHHQHKG